MDLHTRLALFELRRCGFAHAYRSQTHRAIIPLPERPHIRADAEKIYFHGNERTAEDDKIIARLAPIMDTAREIAAVWENAPPLTVPGVENYRKLAEYNGIMLAARDDDSWGLQYVTWEIMPEGGVKSGEYTAIFRMAKDDFLRRSGLLSATDNLEQEEIAHISDALLFRLLNDESLNGYQEDEINGIINRLRDLHSLRLGPQCYEDERDTDDNNGGEL